MNCYDQFGPLLYTAGCDRTPAAFPIWATLRRDHRTSSEPGGRKSQPVQQSFRCNSRRELKIIYEHKMKTRLHHSSSYLTEQARRRAKNVQDPCGISGRRSVGQYQGVRSVATIKSPVRQSGQTDKPNYAKHSSQPGPSPVGMPASQSQGGSPCSAVISFSRINVTIYDLIDN